MTTRSFVFSYLLSYSYNLERAVLIGHFKRQRLLLQCVLETADGVLDLALDLFGLAVRLKLGIAYRLADGLLVRALDLLRRSRDPILIHD
jgi:hypothetical protein